MRHVVKAKLMMADSKKPYINIVNAEDIAGVPPVVSFTVQSDPISQVGVNGVQAEDMIVYVRNLIKSLNDSQPCKENEETLAHLGHAIYFQQLRTRDRIDRGVEGTQSA